MLDTNNVAMHERIEQIRVMLAGKEETRAAPPKVPARVNRSGIQDDAKRLGLIDYLTDNHPAILEWLTVEPEQAFTEDELWLDFKEVQLGMVPCFGDTGERLWHPALLGWAVLRMRVGADS